MEPEGWLSGLPTLWWCVCRGYAQHPALAPRSAGVAVGLFGLFVVQICPICACAVVFSRLWFFLVRVPGRDVCPDARHCRAAAKGRRSQQVSFSGGFCTWRVHIGFLGEYGHIFFFFFFLRFADTHPFPLPSFLRRERDTEEKAASWDVRDVPSSRDRHVLGEGWWQPFPGPATGSSWHHEILGFCNCEEFSFSLNEQVQLQVSEIVSCQTSLPIKAAPFYRIISID